MCMHNLLAAWILIRCMLIFSNPPPLGCRERAATTWSSGGGRDGRGGGRRDLRRVLPAGGARVGHAGGGGRRRWWKWEGRDRRLVRCVEAYFTARKGEWIVMWMKANLMPI